MNLPTLTVLINGTDVTAYVLLVNGHSFSRGRADWQGAVTAGELSLTLNNSDGRFTPGSTVLGGGGFDTLPFGAGAFGGGASSVAVDASIQLKETVNGTTYTRFTGYVKSWPIAWPATVSTFATVQLTATDTQARAERRTLRSMVQEEIPSNNVIAYYPLDGATGATVAFDLTAQSPRLLPANTGFGPTYAFGTDLGLVDGSTGLTFSQGPIAGGGVSFTNTGTTGFGTATWTSASMSLTVVFLQNGFAGASTPLALINIASGTGANGITFNSSGKALFNGCASPTNLMDGLPHVITVQASAALTTDMWVDGVKVSTAAALPNTWDNSFVELAGTGQANGVTTFGNFTYGPRLADADVLDIHKSVVGFSGESGTARMTRVAGYAGITVGTLDTSLTNVGGAPSAGSPAMGAIQDAADAELGLVYIDGTGALTFHNRNRVVAKTAPDLTLDHQWVTPDVQPTVDDQQIVNYFEATSSTGGVQVVRNTASEAAHGRYPASQTYLVQTDQEALDRANWIVAQFAEPTVRYGTLTINLAGMTPSMASTVLTAVDLDCWLRLTSMGSQTPGGTTVDVVVEGFQETVSADTWTLACNVVSRSLYAPVWRLDTSSLGTDTRLYV